MSNERMRPEGFASGPDSPVTDPFEPGSSTGGSVSVIHGVFAHPYPLGGMTVRQARSELEERMNISPQAAAVIDGVDADEDAVLQEGQVLNFVMPSGEKG